MKSICLFILISFLFFACQQQTDAQIRERILINDGWKFLKYDSPEMADNLIYDVRPGEDQNYSDSKDADSRPDEAVKVIANQPVLKPWILPSGNAFIKDASRRYKRPYGNPGNDFPYIHNDFNDRNWESVTLPHDWAIAGPFQEGSDSEVGGGMGRLPINGIAWYRRNIDIPTTDKNKSIFLDIDAAMSYAMVWLNGNLVGGWPYGYNSFRLNLTPYINIGAENQLAIRVDNPNNSARWYSGAGLYRNVWLVKTNAVHVAHWGSTITTTSVSKESATINLELKIDNDTEVESKIYVETALFELDASDNKSKEPVAKFEKVSTSIFGKKAGTISGTVTVRNPKLWGPVPTQNPNRYIAVSILYQNGKEVDQYETPFGIRSLNYNPNAGLIINDELIKFKGVNNHHDLGALGAAFNIRAAERQLEGLIEMGCNSLRMAHNPPAKELLDLCDKMGILVIDEVFDVWERKKTPHDFHLIFPEWYEQDLRSMIRRDKNHPSVIMWSYGNEVGEQYTDQAGAEISRKLRAIANDEDPTRLTTASMNWAKPDFPFAESLEVISMNYQGEGIRQDPMFNGTDRIRTPPQYPGFKKLHPNKLILSSETASAFSSRGIYLFPVSNFKSDIARDGRGADSKISQVSAYELYAVDFGSSADKVFESLEKHPYSAGEFVWTGWDYLGEPTPYYNARSSYNGIIDLAGFKKDRFYLYQSQWRPNYPMVHILPHWNWPERVGKITPIHVFTSGDEAELFLNGKSLGKKKKGEYEYRLRWDDIIYESGEVKVIAYKNGKIWAEKKVQTTGQPAQLFASVDKSTIAADGTDISFITAEIQDKDGLFVPNAMAEVEFTIDGPGEIVATDNGDPTCMVEFTSKRRPTFSGKVLAIVRSIKNKKGTITVSAKAKGINESNVIIQAK